jgi:hypothetical protein
MIRTRQALAALAAVALLAPAMAVAALSGPAAADADGKHRHDLDTYKREAWFEIQAGDHLHAHVYCDAGDYALDGMWKIDAHDGDDRVVKAFRSFADPADVTKWHFELGNPGPGRAQVKLFVTCLDDQTGTRKKHHHDLTFTDAAGSGTTQAFNPSGQTYTLSCAPGQIPVAPGFKFHSSLAAGVVPTAHGPIYISYPTSNELGWRWSFGAGAGPDVAVYLRCIDATTTSAGSQPHTHQLDADLIPGWDGQLESLTAGQSIDRTISSRAHDEGNVGGFWIGNPASTAYLGQDARGQVRTTRFWASGPDNTWLVIWGFDKRTKKNS